MTYPRYTIVVPTRNPGAFAEQLTNSILKQTTSPDRVVIVDSQSSDGSIDRFARAGFDVVPIRQSDFDMGGTRNLGARRAPESTEAIVFLTQDAILARENSIETLLAGFNTDSRVAAVYGRQLPRAEACPLESFARIYNYPATSHTRTVDDITSYGFKTCFFSNSFSAYLKEPLRSIGDFPTGILFGEDVLAVWKLLERGYSKRYQANAEVIHSHGYDILTEFRRHFDIGVLHSRSGIVDKFGSPRGAGAGFVGGEAKFLLRTAPWLLPVATVRNCIKYIGYKVGTSERALPSDVKRLLSYNPMFWRAGLESSRTFR